MRKQRGRGSSVSEVQATGRIQGCTKAAEAYLKFRGRGSAWRTERSFEVVMVERIVFPWPTSSRYY